MTDQVYVTTSIPYVNARPHIGFALELVQADAVARYHRLLGRKVRLQTGSDENAYKNVVAAREAGLTTWQLVERNSQVFRWLAEALWVSADDFLRTTDPRHRRGVHELLQRLRTGDVFKQHYRGLYCVGCEDFLLQRDLVDGLCPDHGKPPAEVQEENYFFRLSAYQQQIDELLESNRVKVVPEMRRNEVLSFVRSGLRDISISRRADRVGGWGIPVPGDPSQIIYVWIDALINYISGPGFGSGDQWRDTWNDGTRKIHVIGKNVWKFHAVYWPALLLSAGLPLPDEIQVHGFLTENGRKISKSGSPTVDPFDCVAKFGADGVRYFLLRAVSPWEDGDFSVDRLREVYNRDLANGLGNLVSRLTTLCERAGYGRLPDPSSPPAPEDYHEALDRFEFNKALESLWVIITTINQEIERTKPWETLKHGDASAAKGLLSQWLTDLHRVAWWLSPLLPRASEKIRDALSRKPITAAEPLFPRVK